jgi:hypothetical protein
VNFKYQTVAYKTTLFYILKKGEKKVRSELKKKFTKSNTSKKKEKLTLQHQQKLAGNKFNSIFQVKPQRNFLSTFFFPDLIILIFYGFFPLFDLIN